MFQVEVINVEMILTNVCPMSMSPTHPLRWLFSVSLFLIAINLNPFDYRGTTKAGKHYNGIYHHSSHMNSYV